MLFLAVWVFCMWVCVGVIHADKCVRTLMLVPPSGLSCKRNMWACCSPRFKILSHSVLVSRVLPPIIITHVLVSPKSLVFWQLFYIWTEPSWLAGDMWSKATKITTPKISKGGLKRSKNNEEFECTWVTSHCLHKCNPNAGNLRAC